MAPTSHGDNRATPPWSESGCGCPIDTAFSVIGKKWSLLLLRNMMRGQRHFNEFLTIPGINPKMLSQRLKDLEQEGLVLRTVASTRPLTVEYLLTDKGYSLFPILKSMARWSLQWAPDKLFAGAERPSDLESWLEQWQRTLLEPGGIEIERRDDVVGVTPRRPKQP